MEANPYQSPREVSDGRAATKRGCSAWMVMAMSVAVMVLGDLAVAIGYGVGRRGFDTGDPATPQQRFLSAALMYGGFLLLAIGASTTLAATIALFVGMFRRQR